MRENKSCFLFTQFVNLVLLVLGNIKYSACQLELYCREKLATVASNSYSHNKDYNKLQTKHFDWTRCSPWVLIYCMTAVGLLTVCIPPPHRCPCHLFTLNLRCLVRCVRVRVRFPAALCPWRRHTSDDFQYRSTSCCVNIPRSRVFLHWDQLFSFFTMHIVFNCRHTNSDQVADFSASPSTMYSQVLL